MELKLTDLINRVGGQRHVFPLLPICIISRAVPTRGRHRTCCKYGNRGSSRDRAKRVGTARAFNDTAGCGLSARAFAHPTS
jgi:hypothetical protein